MLVYRDMPRLAGEGQRRHTVAHVLAAGVSHVDGND